MIKDALKKEENTDVAVNENESTEASASHDIEKETAEYMPENK